MSSSTRNSLLLSESHDDLEEKTPESYVPPENLERKASLRNINNEEQESGVSEVSSRQISRLITDADAIERRESSLKTPLPTMGAGKPYPPALPDREKYEVDFDGPNDPTFPQNWSLKQKVVITACLTFNCVTIAWGSSIFSTTTMVIADKYHVAPVVATLGTTLYVFGFASGPVVWAPLSELYGRQPVLIVSSFGYILFQFAVATAKDLQTILICRFFGGMIGAAPLAVVPAAFADMYGNETRGKAVTLFALGTMIGPIIAPVAGSYIVNSYLGWRWTEYITGIMGALAFSLLIFFYEESHHQIILVNKARVLRLRTGNWGIYAPHEEVSLSLKDIAEKNITRPIYMLFTESILLLITIYNAFVYGLLYLLLTAYPIVFEEGYGMGANGELPYIGIMIGMVASASFCIYMERFYVAKVRLNNGRPVPEARLIPMMFGAVALPIGLFWFTWSGNYHKHVHWIVPTISGLFTGFGIMTIFLPCFNYIIDSYLMFAASAIAGNTFLRSIFGGVFPLFASFMFHNMGTNWAGLVIGLVAVALAPVPILFYKFGKHIRRKSKYAFE